jgi:oxygen-independent coproporphyrinogen-3 oxidase
MSEQISPTSTSPVPPAPAVHQTEVGSVFVSNYPPFSFWRPETLAAYREQLAQPPAEPAPPLGLYLHIPFCRKRCKFCYFRVYVDKNADQIQAYLDALAREVELYARQPAFAGRKPRFVYFGGGTPSYVAVKHMQVLLGRVKAVFPWDEVEEVTFECEPGTLTEPKVMAYRELGITRLSLGVENWSEELLRENGRAHEVKEIDRCLPWIRAAGFPQLNIDLIAGMVGETWANWRDTVQRTIDVGPDSVTIYQMELPFNTVYSQAILREGQESPVADWETKRAWNDYAIDQLSAAGYEISSGYTMVKRDRRAPGSGRFLYRDALWHGADMMGTGIASFGHLQGVHAQNVSGWNEYLDQVAAGELPLGRAFATSNEERFVRELILQTKLGVLDFDYFRRKFAIDPFERYQATYEALEREGMVAGFDREGMRLSRQGLLQVDGLLPHFYAAHYQNARYT